MAQVYFAEGLAPALWISSYLQPDAGGGLFGPKGASGAGDIMKGYKSKARAKVVGRLRAGQGMERLESRLMLAADVVIDEIMYHAANAATPGQPAIGEEYIEIYNK